MRAHGYPTWPDPTVRNGLVLNFIPCGIDTNSPQFNRCEDLRPGAITDSSQMTV